MTEPDRSPQARSSVDAVEALNEATRAVAGVLAVDEVLQVIVDRVRGLVHARYAALGIVDDLGSIERFITSGITPQERARIGPPPVGRGLLGLIIREGRSFRIADIARHPDSFGFPPNHPPMRSFLGVPVMLKGRPIGNLYLTDREDAAEFAEEDRRLVELFALHAGIAIENARLHEQVQRLAVVEERDRIGKDLHDGIIQSIYAVGLSLEDVPDLMAEAPDEATARIDRAIEALHLTIRDIRNFIFGLRPEALEHADLQMGLRTLADEFRVNTLVDLVVELDDRDPPLAEDERRQLMAIVREALSNVARHAHATRVAVRLAVLPDDSVELEVADNGIGFDRASPPGGRPGDHQGVRNMGARAGSLGASLVVDSEPGAGTRIIVRLPTDRVRPGATST